MSNYETSQTSDLKELINKLRDTQTLSKNEWIRLIDGRTPELADYLFENAREVQITHYGHDVYVRGLIEFTNYCRNDCYYCGIRKSNLNAHRYRLTKEEILNCCKTGYELGFRTFVLQGGEDGWFTVPRLADIVSDIHKNWPDCAITLSVGEMEHDAYQTLFDAGADRYLLRHETYNDAHYRKLHPVSLSARHRQNCLWDLKSIGYQIGTGFMVGAPFQTTENLTDDMLVKFSDKLSLLPPYPDVVNSLEIFKQKEYIIVALSNSSKSLLERQLKNAKIDHFFNKQISVELFSKYKPHKQVYHECTKLLSTKAEDCMLIAAHDWDIFGALCSGLRAAFVKRAGKDTYFFSIEPELKVDNLFSLAHKL